MNIICIPFGQTAEGVPVEKFTLADGACTVSILTLGGIVQSLSVPDRQGNAVDVVLGFDTVSDYEAQSCYIGALLGRCANRIADGRFVLSGREYALACNDNGRCHLHGGNTGFDRRIWKPSVESGGLTLRYHSPDGEEGYPGALDVSVTYRLADGALSLEYRAKSNKDTLCNLSSHMYFNLAGHASGAVDEQQVKVCASHYAPIGDTGTAFGETAPVDGTPFDLRELTPFSRGWDADNDQITRGHGYDHHFFVDGVGNRPFAECRCQETGIVLQVESDAPGMQLYSGNFLRDTLPAGKEGACYDKRHGFCVETQFPPNAPCCPTFRQPVLRAGDTFHSQTVFRFLTLKK